MKSSVNFYPNTIKTASVQLGLALLFGSYRLATADSFLVSTIDNAGPGSLREAIVAANLNPGLDTIGFNIPGAGPHAIRPLVSMPLITGPVLIDGTTQPGYAGQPRIELDGSLAGPEADGFVLLSGLSTVRGLAISGFDDYGISIEGSGGNIIQANYIGTDITGTISRANGEAGIGVFDSEANLIGGPNPGQGNLISGDHVAGIFISGSPSTANRILGNLIGTDVTGTQPLGASANGVLIDEAPDTIIGGNTTAERNIISGNGQSGIFLLGATVSQTLIRGNFIGTDITGALPIPNQADGITLEHTQGNTIGGPNPGDRNVISGNGKYGVYIAGSITAQHTVQGNLIGTDSHGSFDIGNGFSGIGISLGNSNVISGNLISGNAQSGIYLLDFASNNTIQNNLIGTDLSGTARLANDFDGVSLEFSSANLIGGPGPGQGNLLSGNLLSGISLIGSDRNQIHGNRVGTDTTGTQPLANGSHGISLDISSANRIGSPTDQGPNLLSGNTESGLFINLGASNIVQGNLVGTDITGALPLPNRLDGITIDSSEGNLIGGTEPGAGNVVSGNFEGGISITEPLSQGNVIQGNLIGTTLSGSVPLPNQEFGIHLHESPYNTIGGTNAGARNVVSSHPSIGILIQGSNSVANVVQGNHIGTGINGDETLGNEADGVCVDNAPFNLIGGTAPGAGNVIANNLGSGIQFFDENCLSNILQGNFIGTDASGTLPRGNLFDGVSIRFASHNLIGGGALGAGNLISANVFNGIYISHPEATFNVIQGNLIGTAIDGESDLGNIEHQVNLENEPSVNLIGGYDPGQANIIAYTSLIDSDGIRIGSGENNRIARNSIFSNAGLGIDLGESSITPNDDQDPDIGANLLQNFPVLTAAGNSLGVTIVTGSLNSNPNRTFRIDFFSNPTCDPSGQGEGKYWLGFTGVTTAGTGNVNFVANLPMAVPAGHSITATATDATGNVSEFSACTTVTGNTLAANLRITKSASPNPVLVGETLTYRISVENLGPAGAFSVRIREALPRGVLFVSASPTPSARIGNVYFFDLATLPNGSTTVITLTVIPQEAGLISNIGSVSSAVPDPSPGNNSVTVQTTVQVPNPNCDSVPLQIARAGSEVVITWFASPGCFVLQQTSSLNPAIPWTDVSGAPMTSGNIHEFRLSMEAGNLFFRLREL